MAKKDKVTEGNDGSPVEASTPGEERAMAQAPQQSKEMSVADQAQDVASWGAVEISQKDIIIPRILLMQPMSEKVTAGEAAFGEFRETLNNEKFGDFNSPMEIIPFYMEKVWVEFNANDPDEKEYLGRIPINSENEGLPYEDEKVIDGETVKIVRDYTLIFYVLLPSEIAVGAALPYILAFRRSSLQAGKKLATQMYVKNKNSGKVPAAVICSLSASKTTNDKKQTYAIADVRPAAPSSVDQIAACFNWLQVIKAGQAKIDTNAFNDDAPVAATPEEVASVETGPAKF